MGASEGRKIAANPMAVMVSQEKEARYLIEIGSVLENYMGQCLSPMLLKSIF